MNKQFAKLIQANTVLKKKSYKKDGAHKKVTKQ